MPEPIVGWAVVDRLVFHVTALVRESRDEDRYLFANVVQPTYEALVAVHEDYCAAYRTYSTILGDDPCIDGCSRVFRQLEADMIGGAPKRAKMMAVSARCRNSRVAPFKRAVVAYLRGAFRYSNHHFANAPRIGLLAELHGILHPGHQRSEAEGLRDRTRAVRVITRCADVLVKRFGVATDEYGKLQTLLRI